MKTQSFGIEVELNHIPRPKAAKVIADLFGTVPSAPANAPYYTIRIPTGDGREWKVMRDSSIPGPDLEKAEVVSPICRWEDIETVQKIIRALREAGAKADPTHCGIHIHIGAEKHTPKTLRNLVNIVNAKEDLLTQALGIDPERRSTWCKPVSQSFLERLNREKPTTMPDFARLWYNDNDWHYHIGNHYDQSRYRLLNLHATFSKGHVYETHCTGTVEFRAFKEQIKLWRYIIMCIICVSRSGIRQPDDQTIRTMFQRNPHGAGYMVARNGVVEIHKGFMNLEEFLEAVHSEHFTTRDSVVYHFRISTQAGINPEMTHPFPLSNQRSFMRALDVEAACGIAHNGIIHLTSDPGNKHYSDTAIFITDYLAHLLKKPSDLRNRKVLDRIYVLAQSKFAIMDTSGYVATVGEFINEHGLLFSNLSYTDFARSCGTGTHSFKLMRKA